MSAEVISFLLSEKDMRKRLKIQFILQCAPLLKGIKTASIMNIERRVCAFLSSILSDTGIEYRILTEKNDKCLVFFFRKEKLTALLDCREIKSFLSGYGYEGQDMEEILITLSKRICQYSRNDITFPHEIGAFLEYPLEDVEGFIRNKGKKYLLCGYWKVYHNPARACMLFHAYEQARNSAVNEWLTGKTITEIAVRRA